jgi:hypothetical protein
MDLRFGTESSRQIDVDRSPLVLPALNDRTEASGLLSPGWRDAAAGWMNERRVLVDHFGALIGARALLAAWRHDHHRPYSSLGNMTPAEMAAQSAFQQRLTSINARLYS